MVVSLLCRSGFACQAKPTYTLSLFTQPNLRHPTAGFQLNYLFIRKNLDRIGHFQYIAIDVKGFFVSIAEKPEMKKDDISHIRLWGQEG